jgi:hypothetical protein
VHCIAVGARIANRDGLEADALQTRQPRTNGRTISAGSALRTVYE